MKEIITLLKSLLGDGVLTAEEIAKAEKADMPADAVNALKGALNLLNKFKGDFPDDVLEAIKTVAKYSSYGYPAKKDAGDDDVSVEKMGARLSKATLEEVKKIREILLSALGQSAGLKKAKEIVEGLLEGAVVEKEDPYKGLPDDVKARLRKLDEFEEEKRKEVQKAADKDRQDLLDKVKALEGDVEALKKTKGVSKAVKGQGDAGGEGEEDEKDNWPSLTQKEG